MGVACFEFSRDMGPAYGWPYAIVGEQCYERLVISRSQAVIELEQGGWAGARPAYRVDNVPVELYVEL